MPFRKRRKLNPAKKKLEKAPKPTTINITDHLSPSLPSTALDSACQLGQDSAKDQAQTIRERSGQNCPPPQPAPATKRKREQSSGENPKDQSPHTPVAQAGGHDAVTPSVAKKQCPEPTRAFASSYTVGKLLGSGGCGSVYAGTRNSDGQEVAIKYIEKTNADQFITTRDGRRLPLEVALMIIVSRPPSCLNVLKLLDWFEDSVQYILVLERPSPCSDLFDVRGMFNGRLSETQARCVMRQVVEALIHCRNRGVFHRDIKTENILVNLNDWTVKLIDFGCGTLYNNKSYRNFCGTWTHCPPEFFVNGCYLASPATTWSLGVLLFEMVCGDVPFENKAETIHNQPKFIAGLSKECQELINWCIKSNPHERPVLEDILGHTWLSGQNHL